MLCESSPFLGIFFPQAKLEEGATKVHVEWSQRSVNVFSRGLGQMSGLEGTGRVGVCVFAVEWYRVDEHFPGSWQYHLPGIPPRHA